MDMNTVTYNRLLGLQWLRTTHPELYRAALSQALSTAAQQTMAGLGDDTMSFADTTGMFDTPLIDDTSSAVSTAASAGSDWGSVLSNFMTNVTGLAKTYISSTSGVAQVQTNANRVTAGLPPLNTDGSVMSAAQMKAAGYPDATIATIENNLARSTGSLASIPWYVWAGLAVVGILLIAKK